MAHVGCGAVLPAGSSMHCHEQIRRRMLRSPPSPWNADFGWVAGSQSKKSTRCFLCFYDSYEVSHHKIIIPMQNQLTLLQSGHYPLITTLLLPCQTLQTPATPQASQAHWPCSHTEGPRFCLCQARRDEPTSSQKCTRSSLCITSGQGSCTVLPQVHQDQ